MPLPLSPFSKWKLTFYFSGGLFVVLCAGYFVSYKLYKRSLYNASYQYKESQAKFFAKLYEQLSNIKFIQTHGLVNGFINRLSKAFHVLLNTALSYQKTSYFFSSIDKAITVTANIVIFLIGGFAVIEGNLSIGTFAIITSYFTMMMSSIRYFFTLGQSIQENTVSLNRLEEIFHCGTQTNGCESLGGIDTITVNNINFSYDDTCVICNFSYDFAAGNMYALIGDNGAGKSTLIDIILGLHIDKNEGRILYNDIAIDNLDMHVMRKCLIGVAEQEPMLLPDTLRYNLTLDENAIVNPADFAALCSMLGLSDFLNSLPQGLDTIIEEKNANLSGGEKQKLSILRALLKDPSVIVLDEPTAALDRESRRGLIELLMKIKTNKIILISTHDTDMIAQCDHVVAL